MAQGGAPPRPPAPFEKKGEVHELRQLLRVAQQDKDQQKKRDALKKVIAYMTLGIDVSPLFSDMIMASATKDLVQKKMVYLYLVNYSESNSDLAILAVNTLLQDFRDDDPMIRGLALRNLCSMNLLNMVEYLTPAIKTGLEDVNGYVRKTAVIGVVKLFHLSSSSVLESDIIPTMKRLLSDSDPHVVSNTIHSLQEVCDEENAFTPTKECITGLLNRLAQFSEWGQVSVLQMLARYQVQDEGEMFDIMNILDSLLKQSSSAVVLAVTKTFIDLTSNRRDLQVSVLQRLKAPLLTLSSTSTPELAYTVLVHVQSLVAHSPDNVAVFGADFKQFFCRYNEPSYIKSTKIEILTLLTDDVSAETIVGELSEYVTDVDAEISRRAIRAIGKIGVRLASAAEMVVSTLTSLLELDIDYVSTESAIVMKDLVRKYPHHFERASGAIERCIKIVTEAEGKCALLWILGEYGLLIEDAPYLLEAMIDDFLNESSGAVRLEMLTACVKLFFSRPGEMQQMLGRLMQKAIQEEKHPDVRDRAMLYYRLLEYSPEDARRVICSPKEVAEEFQEDMDSEAKERIYQEFNTLSVIYKQPAAKFVSNQAALGCVRMAPAPMPEGMEGMQDMGAPPPVAHSMPPPAPDVDFGAPVHQPAVQAAAPTSPAQGDLLGGDMDLLGGFDDPPAPSPVSPVSPAAPVGGGLDLLDMGGLDLLGGLGGPPAAPAAPPFTLAPSQLDANSFQAQWAQLQQQEQQQKQMQPSVTPLQTAAVEGPLRNAGVNVVASGNQGGSFKFFFYAKQGTGPAGVAAGDVWFLVDLTVTPGASAVAVIKNLNARPESVQQFCGLFWQTLGALIYS